IIWMGQRFFFSVQTGIKTIFHDKSIQRRPLVENAVLISGEILLVIGIVLLVFIFVTAKSLASNKEFFDKLVIPFFPQFLINTIKTKIFSILPYIFIFIVEAFVYHYASGSKPSWRICFFAAFLCTVSFWFVAFLMNMFMDKARYNLVYGVLSSLIIMLLDVYIFFTIYFYVAQSIFVYQFFDSLLLSELYLWNPQEANKIRKWYKGALFAIPNQLISDENPRMELEENSIIYQENSESDGIYYIVEGQVKLFRDNYTATIEKGSFFGEYNCILEKRHTLTATTTKKSTLIFINKKQFEKVIESDPGVPQKMMEKVPQYINHIYGRK
ncbi:MAG: YihY/virulence factor BrkB family protein, partial [Treponemataceae bacterium]|nr:YihY/virulence factor BrkB family protein [Treponemataceae bacterium]